MVLIHGLSGSQRDLLQLARDFVDAGFRAIVLDVRGHGASDKPHSPNAYGEQIVMDIRNLLDHLSIKSAHVVGYSMGGDIVNKFREMFPGRTRSCVIGGAGLGVSIGWAEEPHDFARIADSLEEGDGFVPLLRLPGAIVPGVATDKDIAEVNKMMIEGNDTLALAALLRMYAAIEVDRNRLKDNKVRTLVVVGSKDSEYASAVDLHGRLANSKLQVIHGASHFETLLHEAFSESVIHFVQGGE